MNAIESTQHYKGRIEAELQNTLKETSLEKGVKKSGKVRDQYTHENKVILITTDRQSAFDRVLASIPFKGQVLNPTSSWWFDQTKHIIPNQVISVPDPNVTIAKKCKVFLLSLWLGVLLPEAPAPLCGLFIKTEIETIAGTSSRRVREKPKAKRKHADANNKRRAPR